MNPTQYEWYCATKVQDEELDVLELSDQRDRTLLFGYTCERDTFHVYLKDGFIHRRIYNHNDDTIVYGANHAWAAKELVPDKRAYVESTDYEFALILKRKGQPITFTTPNYENGAARRQRLNNGYAGRIA